MHFISTCDVAAGRYLNVDARNKTCGGAPYVYTRRSSRAVTRVITCFPLNVTGLPQQVSSGEQTVEALNHGNDSSFPYFDFNVPRNVTTAVGQTAFLHCRVEQLGDKAVSTLFITAHFSRDFIQTVCSLIKTMARFSLAF
jgi:hypothetical protein